MSDRDGFDRLDEAGSQSDRADRADRADRDDRAADPVPELSEFPIDQAGQRAYLAGGLLRARTDHLPIEERIEIHDAHRRYLNPPSNLLTRPDHPDEQWLARRENTLAGATNDDDPARDDDPHPRPDSTAHQTGGDTPDPADLDRPVSDEPDAPTIRQVLERFAGPDGLTTQQQQNDEAYVAAHGDERPWLRISDDPLVRHVYCERDRQGGHDPARHDAWGDAETQRARAEGLKDPGHATDSPAYHNSVDAFKGQTPPDDIGGNGKQHRCGEHTTWIDNPTIWAAATARILEHPHVKEALNSDIPRPENVTVPISDILGPHGHEYCNGYSLKTDEFLSADAAVNNRRSWVQEVREIETSQGTDRDSAEFQVEQKSRRGELPWVKPEIEDTERFEGGDFQVNLRRNSSSEGFTVSTIFINPSDRYDNPEGHS